MFTILSQMIPVIQCMSPSHAVYMYLSQNFQSKVTAPQNKLF